MNVNPFSYLIEKLKSKVSKSGDTMSGQLNIDQRNGTISDVGFSVLALGNSIASGNANNSTGIIDLYSDSGKKVRLYTVDNVSGTKFIKLPNKDGTVALTSDISSFIHFQNFSGTTDTDGNLTITPNILSTQSTVLGAVIGGYIVRLYVNNSNLWRVNVLTTGNVKVSNTNVTGYVFYVNEKP